VRFVQPGEAFITPIGTASAFDFAGPTRTLSFQMDNATTYWGQSVYFVGDTAELGNWDYQMVCSSCRRRTRHGAAAYSS
jgi:Starch binding domain